MRRFRNPLRVIVPVVAVLLCRGVVFAQQPAAKAAAASSVVNQTVFTTGSSGPDPAFATVLSTSIRPPGGHDLFITFSAQTIVQAQSINDSFFFAPFAFTLEQVAIEVRCLVDGVPVAIAPPSTLANVSLDNLVRITSQFALAIRFFRLEDFLALVTQEGGARSYTWIQRDVGVGVHTVEIQARFLFNNARFPFFSTFSSIAAVIGPKTLTVEEVMLRP